MSNAPGGSVPELSIFQYWDKEEVPDDVGEMMASVTSHNPDLPYRVFSEPAAVEFIANHFGPREVACFEACAVPAMQADYFRYCALLALGGIYIDADNRCVASLRPLIEGQHDAHLFHGDGEFTLAGVPCLAIITFLLAFKRPRHPLLEIVLRAATAQIERRVGGGAGGSPGRPAGRMVWVVTGPAVLRGLWLAWQQESLEAFRKLFAGTEIESFAQMLCEAAGSSDRLAAAFEGVSVSPMANYRAIRGPGVKLAHKSSDVHWYNHRSDIYRSPA